MVFKIKKSTLQTPKIKNRISIISIHFISIVLLWSFGDGGQEVWGLEEVTEEKKEYIDFQKYTGNRLLVFNDTRIDYCIINNEQNPTFTEIAVDAVKLWHERIVEVTQNSEVWNMTTHVFPKDESICDGYVNYYDTPDLTSFQLLGVSGFSHPESTIANITIYTDDYQNTLSKFSDNDKDFWDNMTIEKFQDIIKNGNHIQHDHEMVKRITLHEIGHSLSLNHPDTEDENLSDVPGIMGYNMSYNQIDDEEIINIVKAYPNGFSYISRSESIKLDENNNKKVLALGEIVNLTIELPNQEGKLPPLGIELYIFPEGTTSQKSDNAPIKIVKTKEKSQLMNSGEYLDDLKSVLIHWDSAKVLSVQFKAIKEFNTADIIVKAHRVGGFEESWFLEDVISVQPALFSNLLLEFETTKYKYFLKGSNPNRLLEMESAFKAKQNELYNNALRECLSQKNMKKCTELIKIEDFKIDPLKTRKWISQ